MPDTRAYFPSREEAERFASQFDDGRYQIDIVPQERPGREVFQVHIQRATQPAQTAAPPIPLLNALRAASGNLRLDEPVTRDRSRALGQAAVAKHTPNAPNRREALRRVGDALDDVGLGKLSVLSVTPLVLRVETASAGLPGGSVRCGHVSGFLEGALGALLGRSAHVREVDCVALGNPYCTFAVDL